MNYILENLTNIYIKFFQTILRNFSTLMPLIAVVIAMIGFFRIEQFKNSLEVYLFDGSKLSIVILVIAVFSFQTALALLSQELYYQLKLVYLGVNNAIKNCGIVFLKSLDKPIIAISLVGINCLPFVVFIKEVFMAAMDLSDELKKSLIVGIALTLFFGYMLIFIYFRYEENRVRGKVIGNENKVKKWYNWAISIGTILIIFLPSSLLQLENFSLFQYLFTSLNLIFIFFAILTYFTYRIIEKKWNIPHVLIISSVLIFVFSFLNDNTAPKYLKSNRNLVSSKLSDNFYQWAKDPIRNVQKGTLPVVLIASQGGGIRASVWTMLVMEKLNEKVPNIYDYTYTISGASGGSVGAALYLANLKDRVENNREYNVADSVIKDLGQFDYLSPLIRKNLFHSPIQKIVPFPINILDKNLALENSLEYAFERFGSTEKNTKKLMSQSFLSFWEKEDSKLKLPSLMLNCTIAETGQKVIISNLPIPHFKEKDAESNAFEDVVNFYQMIGHDEDIKFSTAATLSGRFPGITSGALIKRKNKDFSAHITDGGYHDNTGIESILQLMVSIKPALENLKEEGINVEPHLIYIENGLAKDEINSFAYLPELRGVFGSFYNSWDRSDITRDKLYNSLLNDNSNLFKDYTSYSLSRSKTDGIPLGWQISDKTFKKMQDHANKLFSSEGIAGRFDPLIKQMGKLSYSSPEDLKRIKSKLYLLPDSISNPLKIARIKVEIIQAEKSKKY